MGGPFTGALGELGAVHFFDVATSRKLAEVSLNVEVGGHKFEDSYVVDVKASADGKYLYCADVTNFRLAVIDARERRVVGSVPVGRYPYALAVCGEKVYVANIGLFEYSPVPPPKDGRSDKRGLTFPPSAIRAKRPATEWKSKDERSPVWASRMCPNRFPSGAWMSQTRNRPR